MTDPKTFEDLKNAQPGSINTTDEIRAVGLVKEATSRGKTKEWIDEKISKHHPNLITIIPNLVVYEKDTKWIKSKNLSSVEISSSTKKLLYGGLVLLLFLVAAGYYINSAHNLTNALIRKSSQPIQRSTPLEITPSESLNTEIKSSSDLKKPTGSLKNESEMLSK